MTDGKPTQRIDKWLWHARFARTRSLAQKLVVGGKVRVDRAKITSSSYQVKSGNVLTLSLPRKVQVIEICGLADKRGSYPQACLLYKDLSPKDENSSVASKSESSQKTIKEPRPDKHQRRKAIQLKQIYPDE